jgi:hypothetical protein
LKDSQGHGFSIAVAMEVCTLPAVSGCPEKKTDVVDMGEESINEDDLSIFKRQLCYLLELVLDDLAAWYFGRRGRG